MSTSTATEETPRSESPPEGGRYDQFIEQRLDKTRAQVKLVDLASALTVLASGVLGVLLVLAIIDQWILSLGAWGRWLAACCLFGGVAWYAIRIILPLVFGQITQIYAARTVEKSVPSLKNSLINFLMFRSDRAGLRAPIYQALRHQAAADLSHVEVETTVDRTRLIRMGYVLAGVLALCAAYVILSPKSAFQSAFRVVAPWADVGRPSRVRIEDVQPGDEEIYHGESVSVSAACYDVRKGEPVTLFYSTLDGGVSRESVAMQRSEDGLMYRCLLSPGGDGIRRDLAYWIEAGDARSTAYRLTVLPAPTILVERIEYDYPAYTGQPKKVVHRQGDVKGLEGTRVTVRASANVPIQTAVIEFDPHEVPPADTDQDGGPEAARSSSPDPERLELDSEGRRASGSFVLELDAARTRPKHSFYRIRFSTADGKQNPYPILHRIEVTRDLSPEIEILTPTRDRIEVPEDGQQKIELRAIDPDYGLRKITVRAVAGGHDLTTATLLDDPAGQTGQMVVGYPFQPHDHGLHAGDAVAYWAVAEDNRTLPGTENPAPNTAKTRTYHLLIVPPEKQPGPETQSPGQQDQAADLSSPPSHPKETSPPDASTAEDGTAQSMEGGGQKGDDPEGEGGEENQASSDSPASESGAGRQGGTNGQGSGSKPNAETTSGTGADEGSTGEGGERTTGTSASEGGEGPAGGAQPGQPGSSGAGQSSSGGEPGGESPAGRPESGGGSTSKGATREEPLHDGEAFERALEHMRQQQAGDSRDGTSVGRPGEKPESGDTSSGSQPSQGQDGGGTQKSPQASDAGRATSDGTQPATQPKAQDGQGAESSGAAQQQGAQQQDGAGAPKGGGQRPHGSQGAGQKKEGASGESGQPKGGAKPNQGERSSSSGSGKPKDSGQGDSGDSGSGQKNQDQSGSPASEQENRDRQKKRGSQSGKPKPGSGSQSPSISQRQSDSRGGAAGDRSGGGKQGGGQGAKQQGHDSAGSSSPGDEGKAASSESGAGDEANRPGDRAPSEGQTGTPGVQKGPGSATDPAPGGTGEGGTADGPDRAEPAPTGSGSPAMGETDRRGQGIPMGGGKPSNAELHGFDLTGEVPPAEKPNLEYARKATDMVLQYLKDQQSNPDQELLDKLGWTEKQLREFVARWESMKRAAVEDEAGKRQLDEALRSLGLRPRRGTTRQVQSLDDESRGLRDSGGQSGPPPAYREQFKAYKKGTARIKGD